MFDRIAIGRRIVEARQLAGYKSPGALAKALQQKIEQSGNKPDARALARQAVENWEKGKNLPKWENIEIMASVFGPDHDEAWIMFGPRRAQQIQQERSVLARIDMDELRLVQVFRTANEQGKKNILSSAKGIAGDNPADEASLHTLRRKEDLLAN